LSVLGFVETIGASRSVVKWLRGLSEEQPYPSPIKKWYIKDNAGKMLAPFGLTSHGSTQQ